MISDAISIREDKLSALVASSTKPRNFVPKSIYMIAILCAWMGIGLSLSSTRDKGFSNIQEITQGYDRYMGYALNLASGIGYHDCTPLPNDYHCSGFYSWETAFRVPMYAMFLASNVVLFGADNPIVPIRMVQSVLFSLIVFMSVCLAGRLGGNTAALVTGMMVATSTLLVEFSGMIQIELFYTFLLLILVKLATVRRWDAAFATGIVFGLVLMTRSEAILLLFLIPIVYRPRKLFLLFMVGLMIVWLPWIVRNEFLFQQFIPTGTEGGITLWGSNNPHVFGIDPPGNASGGWSPFPTPPETGPVLDEDRFLRDAAISFLLTVPSGRLFQALVAKLVNFTGINEPWPVPLVFDLTMMTLGAVTLTSIFRRSRRRQLTAILRHNIVQIMGIVCANSVLITLIFYGLSRFQVPFVPFMAVFTGVGISLFLGRTPPASLPVAHGAQLPLRRWLTPFALVSAVATPLSIAILLNLFATQISIHQTADWLRDHIAAYTYLGVDKRSEAIIQLVGDSMKTWDLKPASMVEDKSVADWYLSGALYLVLDENTPTSMPFIQRVQTLVDGGGILIYESPLPLGKRQAVFWTFRPQHILNFTFANALLLVGYNLEITGSQQISLLMHWYTLRPPDKAYHIFAHLIDSQTGKLIAQADEQVGTGIHSTNQWRQNEIVFDPLVLLAGAAVLNNHYQIQVGLYELSTGARASIYDENQKAVGDHFTIEYPSNP